MMATHKHLNRVFHIVDSFLLRAPEPGDMLTRYVTRWHDACTQQAPRTRNVLARRGHDHARANSRHG